MNILTVLEVAIGIMFVWFLASMLVSSIQELVASLLHWRAKDLENEIRQMLEHPEQQSWLKQAGSDLKATGLRVIDAFRKDKPPAAGNGVPPNHAISLGKFYQHPLIKDLSLNTKKAQPSYISTTRFADVLFDLIVDAGSKDSPILRAARQADELLKDLDAADVEALSLDAQRIFQQFKGAVEEVSRWTAQEPRNEALIQKINILAAEFVKQNPDWCTAVELLQAALHSPPLREQLVNGVQLIMKQGQNKEDHVGKTLNVLITRAMDNAKDADSAIAAARQQVEAWFDGSMERLTGNYRRNVHYFSLVAGLLIALLLNFDSLAIVRTLWFDPTVRAAVVSNAQNIAQPPQGAAASSNSVAFQAVSSNPKSVQQVVADMRALQIPLGWSVISDKTLCKGYYGGLYNSGNCIYPSSFIGNPLFAASEATAPESGGPTIWASLLGIVITGLAVMPGAPFWFDWISKLASLRAAGEVSPSSKKSKKKTGTK